MFQNSILSTQASQFQSFQLQSYQQVLPMESQYTKQLIKRMNNSKRQTQRNIERYPEKIKFTRRCQQQLNKKRILMQKLDQEKAQLENQLRQLETQKQKICNQIHQIKCKNISKRTQLKTIKTQKNKDQLVMKQLSANNQYYINILIDLQNQKKNYLKKGQQLMDYYTKIFSDIDDIQNQTNKIKNDQAKNMICSSNQIKRQFQQMSIKKRLILEEIDKIEQKIIENS